MPATPCVPRWTDRARRAAAAALLLAAAACQPREPAGGPAPAPAPPPRPAPPGVPNVPPLPAPAPGVRPGDVRVGLVVDTPRATVGSTAGLLVDAGGRPVEIPAGQVAVFTRGRDGLTVQARTEGGQARGTWNVPEPAAVRPVPNGLLTVRGQPYRGAIHVQRAPRGDGLTLVNQLDMETYLLGVVPREIGRVGDDLVEAAKAQAVAARTYAVRYLGRRSALGFDVYATVDDQVYGGAAAEHTPVSRAVRETAGQILTYRGEPVTAYYHSTCAGHTAAIDEVWRERPVPYLVAVRDVDPRTGEAYDRSSSRFTWTERWTHDELVRTLNRTLADSLRGRRISQVRGFAVRERTPSGRVAAARLETDAGTFTLGRDRVRWILVPTRGGILNSSRFDVRMERSGNRVTAVVLEGGGWGHGIGMCQVGAMGRARAGQDYREILRAYYPGTEVTRAY